MNGEPNKNPEMPYGYSNIMHQLERLDERTRNNATRADIETLRRELVAREALEPQLNALRTQIARLEADRLNENTFINKRIDDVEDQQMISKNERFWTRIGPAIAGLAFIISLIEFLSHIKFIP